MNIYILGASKYALELSRYLKQSNTNHNFGGYIAESNDGSIQKTLFTKLDKHEFNSENGYLIGSSDRNERKDLINKYGNMNDINFINIIHPTAIVEQSTSFGVGNVIGPFCYLGINVEMGSFNVFSNHSSVGHHSSFGNNNFISPNFHCGNSISVASDNFFGVSCVVTPATSIGEDNRFQASTCADGCIPDGQLCFSSARLKITNL